MKTKAQKQAALKVAKERLAKSQTLLFADFGKLPAEDLRKLRREMMNSGASFSVVKKRLLNVMFKEEGIEYDARAFDGQVGTIFAEGTVDTAAGPLYRFLNSLGADAKGREEAVKRILGGYDLGAKSAMDAATVTRIGTLPSRDVLLAMLFGMLAAPIRSFLYLLDQKSKQAVESK